MLRILNRTSIAIVLSLLSLLVALPISAEDYDEAVDGPLSSDGLNPTALIGTLGSNLVDGSVGVHPDVRYFSITVPAGAELTAIQLTEHTSGDNTSWFAAMSGAQFTENDTSGFLINTENLLGHAHIGTANGTSLPHNVLPNMNIPNTPLPAGTYSFRMQNWGTGIDFAFNMVLAESEPSAVTVKTSETHTQTGEPTSWFVPLIGLACLLIATTRTARLRL